MKGVYEMTKEQALDNTLKMMTDAYTIIKEMFPDCNHLSMYVDSTHLPEFKWVQVSEFRNLGRRDGEDKYMLLASKEYMVRDDGSVYEKTEINDDESKAS